MQKAPLALKGARNGLDLAAAGMGKRRRDNPTLETLVPGWRGFKHY